MSLKLAQADPLLNPSLSGPWRNTGARNDSEGMRKQCIEAYYSEHKQCHFTEYYGVPQLCQQTSYSKKLILA